MTNPPLAPPATPGESSGRGPGARTRHARWLFSGIPRHYDLVAETLSFGQNGRWRRAMVAHVHAGLRESASASDGSAPLVLDVATGPAAVVVDLARATSASLIGLDQSPEMLGAGIERVRREGLAGRVRFAIGQGERLPFPDARFDAVTFTYLLRYVDDPAAALMELSRVLRPGGTLANLEFDVPSNPVWRASWIAYTRVGLPLAGRLVSRPWYEVGRFLGPSISGFYDRHPLSEQLSMWRAAGIDDVRAREMSLGGGVVIWGTKRDA